MYILLFQSSGSVLSQVTKYTLGMLYWKNEYMSHLMRQNKQNDCAPSKDSDQPRHPPSLIRVFTVR